MPSCWLTGDTSFPAKILYLYFAVGTDKGGDCEKRILMFGHFWFFFNGPLNPQLAFWWLGDNLTLYLGRFPSMNGSLDLCFDTSLCSLGAVVTAIVVMWSD